MQLFLRDFSGQTKVLDVPEAALPGGLRVSTLERLVEAKVNSPVFTSKTLGRKQCYLTHGFSHIVGEGPDGRVRVGRRGQGVLQDGDTLCLHVRLLGGKGGFGSLLRSSKNAVETTNFDACRDLSGRRIQAAEAEKKLQEWQEEEAARKLEEKAERHLREVAKEQARKEKATVDIQAFREELASTSEKVASAVKSGLLARSALKRKGAPSSAADGDGDGKEDEAKGKKAAGAGSSAAAAASAKGKGKKPRWSSALEDEFSDTSDEDDE